MIAAPVITTDRFDLWRPAMGDLDGLVALLDGDEMTRFLGPARATHASQFMRWLTNVGCWEIYGYGVFMVRQRGNAAIIGSCGVFHSWRGYGDDVGLDDVAEAGWIVRHDHWGQGVASEVMQAALGWFDANHGPKRMACMIAEGNAASIRLAGKLGFAPYGDHTIEDNGGAERLLLFERL